MSSPSGDDGALAAATELVKTFHTHRLRIPHLERERIKWIAHLDQIVKYAEEQNWDEPLGRIAQHFRAWDVALRDKKLERIPSMRDVLEIDRIDRLVARSYVFFRLFLDGEKEDQSMAVDHTTKDHHESTRNKLVKPRRSDHHHELSARERGIELCLELKQGEWESSLVTFDMRYAVFVAVVKHRDPTREIETIRDAVRAQYGGVETAAIQLVNTYNTHKMRISPAEAQRIQWITLLPKILSHAVDRAWPEALDSGLRKCLLQWDTAMAQNEPNYIPSTDDVSRGEILSPLVSRSYDFFQFFVTEVEREVSAELIVAPIPDGHQKKQKKKLRRASDARQGVHLGVDNIVRICQRLTQDEWESSRVTSGMRERVYYFVGARTDPTVAIDAIHQAVAVSSHSLGRRRRHDAPIGIRQRSMYFPDRQI
ncbi:hypothetical protein JCM3766R1_005091 [Sporobolomyces carnicolor]